MFRDNICVSFRWNLLHQHRISAPTPFHGAGLHLILYLSAATEQEKPLTKLQQSTLCGKRAGVGEEGVPLLPFSLPTQWTEISRNAHIFKQPESLYSYVVVRHLTPQQHIRAKNKSERAGCVWYSGPTG